MTNGALAGMIAMLWHVAGLGAGILWGAAVGLPIRRAIIRKWAKVWPDSRGRPGGYRWRRPA